MHWTIGQGVLIVRHYLQGHPELLDRPFVYWKEPILPWDRPGPLHPAVTYGTGYCATACIRLSLINWA